MIPGGSPPSVTAPPPGTLLPSPVIPPSAVYAGQQPFPTFNATNWSENPATSVIDAANFPIQNVSEILLNSSTTNTLTTNNLNELTYNGVPIIPGPFPAPSTWSQYPATQTVDLSANTLTNTASILFNSLTTNTLTTNNLNELTYNGNVLATGSTTPATWANYPAVATVDLAGFDLVDVPSGGNFLRMSGNIELNAEATSGEIDLRSAVGTIIGTSLRGSSVVVDKIQSLTGTFGTAGQVLASDGAKIVWVAPSGGATAVGPAGAVQYSDGAGAFQGNAGLTYDGVATLSSVVGANTNLAILNDVTGNMTLSAVNTFDVQTTTGAVNLTSGTTTVITSFADLTLTNVTGDMNLNTPGRLLEDTYSFKLGIVTDGNFGPGGGYGTAGQVLTAVGGPNDCAKWADLPAPVVPTSISQGGGSVAVGTAGEITATAATGQNITIGPATGEFFTDGSTVAIGNGTLAYVEVNNAGNIHLATPNGLGPGGPDILLDNGTGDITVTANLKSIRLQNGNTELFLGNSVDTPPLNGLFLDNARLEYNGLPVTVDGVTSLNSLTGGLSITAGTGISVSAAGSTVQVTAVPDAGLQNALKIVPTATGQVSLPVSWTGIQPSPNTWVPDLTTASPIAGGYNNGWRNFKQVGTSGFPTKVAWYPYNPKYLASLPYTSNPSPTFRKCDLKSVWAVIYTKNRINIQGNIFFNIYTYDITNPPTPPATFTNRFDYNIPQYVTNQGGASIATGIQTLAAGYRYLIYCVDDDKLAPQTTATVAATLLVSGTTYTILTLGTSNFTLAGAAVNAVGCVFVATGPTIGSGSVTQDIITTVAGANLLISGSQVANQTGFLRDPYDIETGIHHISFNTGQIVTGGAPQPADVSLLPVTAIAISTNSGTVTPTLDFTVERIGFSAANGPSSANLAYELTF